MTDTTSKSYVTKLILNLEKPKHPLTGIKHIKDIRNAVNSAVNREKKAFLAHAIRNGKDQKQVWRILKKCKVISGRQLDLPDIIGSLEDINNYFVNSASNIPVKELVIRHYEDKLWLLKMKFQKFNIKLKAMYVY